MEKGREFDTIDRMEASAPNLKPVQHKDGSNYVCCTEVFKQPRPKLCEGSISHMQKPPVHCLCKSRPIIRPCQIPSGQHERDILFRPIRWRCKPQAKVVEKMYEPSLGSPIGLSKSSFSMSFLETKSPELSLQGFATHLIAFAEYFITPEIEWDEKVLNRVLLEGQRLFNDSKAELSDGEQLSESMIKKTFMLCDNAFDVMVNNPFLVGHVIGDELPVPNLHWGLLKFFKKFQFCLLQIGNWYILLWKNADVYFAFDCFGRRIQDFRSDRKRGIAMLICLRNLDNVSHLILNLSGVQPDQLFTIRHLQIKSLVPCGGEPTPDIIDRSIQFEVLSPDYAILRGRLHLGSSCFREIRHRQSLPVAISALINAKIDATPTWDSGVLDKIIKLGAQFYKQWTQCDISLELGIQDIPNRFVFGQFMVEIAVNAIAECGLWKCTPNYRHSELTAALKRAFGRGSNLLVQIQGRSYAVWKKGSFYYILDPYSHQCTLTKKKNMTASLRMCGSVERMTCIFTQALLELFEESKFLIHLVKILKVEEIDKIKEIRRRAQVPCMCLATPQTDDAEEALSLNESVFGVGGYECEEEVAPVESDSADLDSPGLSQTRLEDYTDLRRGFMDESEDETEDDEEEIDLDGASVDTKRHDETDSEDGANLASPQKEKKSKKEGGGGGGGSPKDKAGGDANNKGEDRGKKRKIDSAGDDGEPTEKKKLRKDEDEVGDKVKDKKKNEKNKKKDKDNDIDKDKENDKDKNKEKDIAKEKAKEKDKDRDKDKVKDKSKNKDKAKSDDDAKKDSKGDVDKKVSKKDENEKADKKVQQDEPKVQRKPSTKSSDTGKKAMDQDTPADDGKGRGERQVQRESSGALKSSKTAARRQKHQRRKQQDGEDTSSDEIPRTGIPAGCKPNSYPGFTEDPQDLAVVGSESGSYDSLCCLLKSAFRCADRVLTMTPWGNYVAFHSNRIYFIFDGCTCNLRSIRHMDLNIGTAGLLCFADMHSLINYIESGKEEPKPVSTSSKKNIVEQICSEYCGHKPH